MLNIFLVFALTITSFAQKEICIIDFNIAHSAQQKARMAELRKEIASLREENKKCFMGDTTYCNKSDSSGRNIGEKRKECRTFNILPKQKCYNPLDTNTIISFEIFVDIECNEKKKFVMEDKKNKILKDSIFKPQNEYWEVNEKDGSTGSYKNRTSNGNKREILYDEEGRLINYMYIIRRNDKIDTLAYEQYFWEKGKLVKTIFKGVTRNFIYGTPCDYVIVTPSDDALKEGIDFNPPPMYNKSFGLIPEENDPEYEKFKRYPYSYYAPTELLEKQKRRCEEYKKSQKKKGNGK